MAPGYHYELVLNAADHVNDYSAWIDDGYEGWRTHGYL